MSCLLFIFTVAFIMFAVPNAADAHLVTTGLGPFYDGALHLLMSPEELLGLLAVILIAGLQGVRACRLAVFTLAVTWLAAGFVGLFLPIGIKLPWLSVLFLVVLGGIVAFNPALSPALVSGMAGVFGTFHGLFNGSAFAAIGAGPLPILGIAVTVLIVGLLCSAWIVSLQAAWTRIVVRVAGSWITAVGTLMFGWLAKGSG